MAILVCLVIAGSLLGNSFVASRMTVAAAKKEWIPDYFTIVGRVGLTVDSNTYTRSRGGQPQGSDAPINAVILSALLGTMYILFGDFRALLTLNGLAEFSFFFLTVLGAIILRYREPKLHRPYKTYFFNPLLFVLVSGFVIVRGALFAPQQALVIMVVWALGLICYKGKQMIWARTSQ